MRYERIDEPIEVIVHFGQGALHPLKFLWKGRSHKVGAVRGVWTTFEGQHQQRHFAVNSPQIGNCEITFDTAKMIWRLHSVAVVD